MNHQGGTEHSPVDVSVPRFSERRIRALRAARVRTQAILVLLDVTLLLLAFYLAGELRQLGGPGAPRWSGQALQVIPFYLLVAIYNGAYSLESLKNARSAIQTVTAALAIAVALRLFMTFIAKTTGEFSRAIFIIAIFLAVVELYALRFAVLAWVRRNYGRQLNNVLVIEDGGKAVILEGAYRVEAQEWDLRPTLDDPAMLDRLGRLARNMDRVIVSCPVERRQNWVFLLRGLNVRGEVVSDGLHELGALGLKRDDHFTSLMVATGPLGIRARALKRLLDLAITIPAVIVMLPVYVAVAIAIKLEDGGPVMFVQERMGRSNCTFKMLKFRSMRVTQLDSAGHRSASIGDDRVTRIGQFIRRTSIDELPQLFNVLRGDMSLVGPRPHALGSRAGGKLFWEIDPRYWHRHALKPGLTGLAQVRGHRGATDEEAHLTDRLHADLEYVSTWTPWSDILIILQTARVLIHDRAF